MSLLYLRKEFMRTCRKLEKLSTRNQDCTAMEDFKNSRSRLKRNIRLQKQFIKEWKSIRKNSKRNVHRHKKIVGKKSRSYRKK